MIKRLEKQTVHCGFTQIIWHSTAALKYGIGNPESANGNGITEAETETETKTENGIKYQ